MSIFEICMLICFGAAWPFSILKSYRSQHNHGKSARFLLIILLGYVSGTCHKIFYAMDGVVVLYIVNGILVAIDLGLYIRNNRRARKENHETLGN